MNHLTNHPLNCSTAQMLFCPLHLSRVLYKSTLFMQNKPNLLNAQMNLNSYSTKDYENKRLCRCVKTNPIQTQYKPNTNPIPERPKMNENLFATKGYENITTFRLEQNKPNLSLPKGDQTQSQKGCVLSPMPKIFAAGGQFPHARKLAFCLEPKLSGFIMLSYFGVLQKDKENGQIPYGLQFQVSRIRNSRSYSCIFRLCLRTRAEYPQTQHV